MPKFHVIAGPDATPAYPIVRKIGPADLKDALAKGVDDFWAMPTSLVFLGLIYPIVGMCLAGWGSRRCAPEGAHRCLLVGRRRAPPIGNPRANQKTRARSIGSIRSMDCPAPETNLIDRSVRIG